MEDEGNHILYPLLLVGPANSGKLLEARRNFGCAPELTPRLRSFEFEDYTARFIEFSTHFEIDVTDLSMVDKRILPELLQKLIGTRDVLSGKKKLIIRRIHNLSPPAAVQLRVCLEQFVWPIEPNAIVQCTARLVNSSVSAVMDGFVYKRVPKSPDTLMVNELQEFIYKIVVQMLAAKKPSIEAVTWIRARVYEIMGLMITGGDLIAWSTLAIVRLAADGKIATAVALRTIRKLSEICWIPSYRIPLMMEFILVEMFDNFI